MIGALLAVPAAVKTGLAALAVAAAVGGVGWAIVTVNNRAYERGHAAAEQKSAEAIRSQRDRFRAELDRLKTLPADKLDCELLRLTKPETVCP